MKTDGEMVKDEWVDMHVHTYFSDGLLSPTQVVISAKEAGLKGVGITDHDTLDGIEEAQHAGKRWGIEIIPGIELSSQYNNMDIHILGYYCDYTNPKFVDYIKKFQIERYNRAEKMVKKLNQQGINITIEDVENEARGKSIGRPHLAAALLEKGYVNSYQEAFHRFIGYRSKAYVEKFKIEPEAAIRLISEVNGASFLAHPSLGLNVNTIFKFIKAGLDGIEIIHPKISDKQTRRLQDLVNNYNLLVCGGSDCHGGQGGKISIGKYRIPYAVFKEIKTHYHSKRKQVLTESKQNLE